MPVAVSAAETAPATAPAAAGGGEAAAAGTRRLVGAAVALALLACAATGGWLWVLREHRLQFNDRLIRLQTAALAEHVGVVFESANTSLRATLRDLREGLLDPHDASTALRRRVGANSNLEAMRLLDAHGTTLAGSSDDHPAPASLAAPQDDALHIEPARDGAAIELTRRAAAPPEGGVWRVDGRVDARVVTDFFARVAIAKDARAGLYTRDGRRLAGDLDLAALAPPGAPVAAHAAVLAELLRRGDTLELGRYFAAAQTVGKLPMVVVTERERAAVLAPWFDNALSALAVTAAGLAALAFVVLRLRREMDAHRRAQADLEHNRERTRLAFEAAQEGTWAWDAADDTLELSPRMAALLGVPGTRVAPSFLGGERIHRDDRAAIEHAAHAHLKGYTEQLVTQFRVATPDGGWRWIHARGRASRDAQGRVLQIVGTASDETEARRRSDQLHELQTRLQRTRRLEALGRLSGGIAHDFNNILAVILGFGDLAHRQAPGGGEQARQIEQLLRAGERGRNLVARILAFSSGTPRTAVAIDVDAVVAEVLDLLPATAPPGVRIDHHLAADGASVLGDATQLFEALGNLCSNAIHAMPRGGLLRIESGRLDTPAPLALSHGTVAPGRHVRIVVCDDGDGIGAEALERLFEPFYTTRRESGGTGLGLSMVHGAVKDMNGALDVTSAPGAGARFEIVLPIAETSGAAAAPDAAGAEAAAPIPRGSGQVVLVVDDEPALVALAEDVLAGLGYEPAGFRDPAAALAAFERTPNRFDAVLTDQVMPAMSGVELARRLRAVRPDVPVLLASGFGGDDLARRAREAGVRVVARKPLHRGELARLLADALSAPR